MAPRNTGSALRQIRDLISSQTTGRQSDAQLLERFALTQDEAAFAALMRRYGSMVLHSARRVLNDWQAAEDVFQATFLVLARRATSIRQQESIGGWLHGIAYRLALKARHAARPREWTAAPPPEETPDPLADMTMRELRPLLDEELARIPEKYRAPLLLCYLEGKTRDEAAHQLGWPLGTLKSRLERGRELLRERLVGRGLTLSATLWATALNADPAPVPAALLDETFAAALRFAGGTLPADAVPINALTLAEGMVNTMIPAQLKIVAALLVTIGLLGTAGLGSRGPQNAAAQDPPVVVAAAAEQPPAEKPALADLTGDALPPHALARLGTLRWRYTDSILYVGFIEKGKQLITVGQDGNWRLWDVKSGEELKRFGKVAAAPADGGDDLAKLAVQARLLNGGSVTTVALSPDGTTLATTKGDGQVSLKEVATGKELGSFKPEKGINGLTFAPDGKSIYVNGTDQIVRQCDVPDGKEQKKFGKAPEPPANGAIRRGVFGGDVAVSPDGAYVAAFGSEIVDNRAIPQIKVWDTAKGDELATIKPEARFGATGLMFLPDSKYIAYTNGDGTSTITEVADPKKARKVGEVGRGRFSAGLLFTADGKALLEKRFDQTVHLLEVESSKDLRTYGEPYNPARINNFVISFGRFGAAPREMALSPDGKTLAVVGGLNMIRLFDVETGKEKQEIGGHQASVAVVSLSPDGKTVTTRGADNTIRQWDAATGKQLSLFKLPDGSSTAAFAPDGKSIAVARPDNTVGVYEVATGKELAKVELPGGAPGRPALAGALSLAFSPDGKTLATRGNEAVVRLWEIATGKELRSIKEESKDALPPNPGGFVLNLAASSAGLAFTPDGTAVVSVSGANNNLIRQGQPATPTSQVRVFHVGTGKAVAQFEVSQNVKTIALAPDGRSVALALADQTITVREMASGKERCQFKVSADTLLFAPDGRTLATAGADRAVHILDLAAGKEVGQFTGHNGSVRALAFATDGRKLISGSDDTSGLIWDATALLKGSAAIDLDDNQLDALWADLIGADAARAYQAVTKLSQAPRSLTYLGEHVKPAVGVDAKRLAELTAALESDKFAERQRATDDLEKLGDLAVPALERVLAGQPALEIKQRVEHVLERLVEGQKAPPAEILRAIRAVEALHQLGTPEAKELLQVLAKGAPGARLTREAQKSLDLLAK